MKKLLNTLLRPALLGVVMLGLTFFSASMWTGGTLGTSGNNPRVTFSTAPAQANGILGYATVARARARR